jgi:hypothetical protein
MKANYVEIKGLDNRSVIVGINGDYVNVVIRKGKENLEDVTLTINYEKFLELLASKSPNSANPPCPHHDYVNDAGLMEHECKHPERKQWI